MGCGCGGRKNNRPSAIVPRPANSVNARQAQIQPAPRQVQAQVQPQTNQRQAIAPQSPAGASRFLGAKDEMEKRRRIQVSLRKRQRG